MTNELVGYTPRGGALSSPATHAAPASAMSLAGSDFVPTRALTWADMPAQSARAARPDGPVVFDWVEDEDSYQRKIDGVLHQERFGVLLTATQLVYARAVRALARDSSGRYRPSGAWQHHDVLVTRLTSFHQQAAHLPADVQAATPSAGETGPDVPRELRHAETTLSYLPPRVQATVRRDSPSPTVAKGVTIQMSRGHIVSEQTIKLIRFNADRGVLVVAYRRNMAPTPIDEWTFARLPWDVTQTSFTLGAGSAPREVGASARKVIGGRR